MPHYDLPAHELVTYRSSAGAPADLREFWTSTLDAARAIATPAKIERVHSGLRVIDTWDVTFSGFGGHPVRAWYHRPRQTQADLPIVVRFQGYGGGRGLAHRMGPWALAGYACLEVDTRGQGSAVVPGDTSDPEPAGEPSAPGFLTRGILDPETYYYRRVFTDAVRATEVARELPGVDPDRVAVGGISQGGGISLAVASLADNIATVMADVPFLTDVRRAVAVATTPPYTELVAYLATHCDRVDRVFSTLAYFDTSVLVRAATAPALFSVGLMDQVCPPSTVYAAYNAYAGPKEIRTYPFNDHEGGHAFQERAQLAWLGEHLPIPPSP